MSWVAAAVGGATLLSGMMGADAARSASDAQVGASRYATGVQQGMFDKTQANLQPYMQGGNVALSSLLSKLQGGQLGGTFTNQDFLNNLDPGYQFQLDQGNQALTNSLAAKDGVLSGSALKNLINYNQGMAATGYENAYQRWLQSQQNAFTQLYNTAGLGESAAAGAGSTAANFAPSIANTITSGANAQAAGTIGSTNAMTGSLNNFTNMYLLNNLTKGQLFGGNPSAAAG